MTCGPQAGAFGTGASVPRGGTPGIMAAYLAQQNQFFLLAIFDHHTHA